jgi:hypothetical protein
MVEITLPIVLQILQTVGILVGIIYYITIMRNQSRARQLQILKDDSSTMEHIIRVNSMEFTDYGDFIEKYGMDADFSAWMDFLMVFNQFEEYGVYLREGLLDIRFIALLSGGMILTLQEKFMDVIREHRIRNNYPRFMIEAEYLMNNVKKYMDEHPELKT